ncbi:MULTISPECIES: malate dehydrogenase [Staphylococcus]|nr:MULTISPECIES: malate dehydrogenase [Staphylococcus]QPA23963.1 malate dehydrogenase [Mammaliicoccus fleurettii]QPA34193.1 malate dehydrogenase [Mammaliicoccus fleurettii]UXR54649.1 malate dehydrogenase [Staphylococcus schleiferi]UXR56957.1 malate dehydrogenase [Staphylococcus schleiferi]UXR59241.1 malate dehydrogenase [Staphylococcus schleiferi]
MNMKRKKVSIIGSGHTGATLAFIIAMHGHADVLLVDREKNESVMKGKALDMQQSGAILGFNVHVHATVDYAETKDSDVVVITAGLPRQPGMSRDDLVQTNEEIMVEVTQKVVKYSPNCTIIVLTNPVDAMTYTVYRTSGFPSERVMGQSGVLDTARFNTFVAEALNVAVKDVTGLVLGGHGDTMVPLIRHSQVNGVLLTELMPQEQIDAIVERTRKGGAEIVKLLGNGSAYYAPAAAVYEMVLAILEDQKRVLPTIAYCQGEYQLNDIYIGVPAILGANGVERIIELELNEDEQQQLAHSVEAVESVKASLKTTSSQSH